MIRAICAGLLAIGCLLGQPAPQPLAFDVASIKPASGDEHRVGFMVQPGGGLRTSGTTLKNLLTFAYDVRDFQLSGGPGWISSDRYDILAKVDRAGNSPDGSLDNLRNMTDSQRQTFEEQLRQRLQALLADRFQLKIHRDTKEAAVYALVVAKNGPKLQPSDSKAAGQRGVRMGRGMLNGQGVDLRMFAMILSNQLGRPVIDRTGLTGPFDVKLEWTPDPGESMGPKGVPPPGVEGPPPPDPNGPSIFTAVQEQLGLRLEPSKGPVELIVIDSVEKPSEN